MTKPPTARRCATTETGSVPNWGALREPRVGVCLHYDGSASDAGAVNWLTKHPDCRVSYHRLITDDGQAVKIAPDDARAWHAGVCRPSSLLSYQDANSALYGLAFAAKAGDTLTYAQVRAAVKVVRVWYAEEDWALSDLWRITDHRAEAWPRGRKVDIGSTLRYLGKPFTIERFRSFLVSPEW